MTSAAIVGAGAAVMLRRAGYHDVAVFERGERVGGVWPRGTVLLLWNACGSAGARRPLWWLVKGPQTR